jgi:hypothetical protein
MTKHRPHTTDKEAYSVFLSASSDIALLSFVFLVVVEFGIVMNLQNFLDYNNQTTAEFICEINSKTDSNLNYV